MTSEFNADVRRRPIFSTLVQDHVGFWVQQVVAISSEEFPRLGPWLLRAWRDARGREVVILRGTVGFRDGYRDLVLGAALRRWPGYRGRIVVSDATLEPGSKEIERLFPGVLRPLGRALLAGFSRLLVRAVDGPETTWCVLSRQEERTFRSTWGIKKGRVRFTPFPHTLWDDLGAERPTTIGDYFFAGGDSLRDYSLLEEAVARSGLRTVVASRRWTPTTTNAALDVGPRSHEEFMDLMANARAVVVPIVAARRSAGQQTYLNAMALGKIVVVNEAPGVDDYIQHGINGLVSGSTPGALAATLRQADTLAMSDEGAVMSQHARAVAHTHSTEAYLRRLLHIATGREVEA